MDIKKLFFVAVVSVLLLSSFAGVTHASSPFQSTTMRGSNEAPGPGDPDGKGLALVRLYQTRGEVCYTLIAWHITLPATGAHIHVAPPGQPGPVVIPLTAPGINGVSHGCQDVDQNLIQAIREDPSSYYVNVHTSDYPNGAIRGQL